VTVGSRDVIGHVTIRFPTGDSSLQPSLSLTVSDREHDAMVDVDMTIKDL